MNDSLNNLGIVFLGNYLPRRCGIATFTTDLCEAVAREAGDGGMVFAAAMNDTAEGYDYPERVKFELGQNAPNPFSGSTLISYRVARPGPVTLRVYDLRGRLVRTLLAAESMAAGRHEAVWNGRDETGLDVSAGVYLLKFEAGDFRSTQSVTLVK